MAVPRSQGRYLKVGNRDGIPLKKRNRAMDGWAHIPPREPSQKAAPLVPDDQRPQGIPW